MKCIVIGMGSFGAALAIKLTENGNEVIGVDVSQDRVDAVNAKRSPIVDAEISQYMDEKDLNFFIRNFKKF